MQHPINFPKALAGALTLCVISGGLSAGPASGSYREARDAWLAESAADTDNKPFTAGERQIVQPAAEALARTLPDPGIKPGEPAPDFTLTNAHGQSVRLTDRLREGPVVLEFYRGAWCPFRNLHLRSL